MCESEMNNSSNFQNAMLEVGLDKSLVVHGGKNGAVGFVEEVAKSANGNSANCPGNGSGKLISLLAIGKTFAGLKARGNLGVKFRAGAQSTPCARDRPDSDSSCF